ncbi:MAG: DUF5703 domain-containing protein [Planctomycetota bacterium]
MSESHAIDRYNVAWTTPSKNSSESMPCSGGDIGVNVWVEKGELLLYVARAGCRDENGALLKLGRIRIALEPNPLAMEGTRKGAFRQELKLSDGSVEIRGEATGGARATVRVWVEVHRPVIHVDIEADRPTSVAATYETWRFRDITLPNDRSKHHRRAMCMINYDVYPGEVRLHKDAVEPGDEAVTFYHRVREENVFDFQVRQQSLEKIKAKLWDPLAGLTFGGMLTGDGLVTDGVTDGSYADTPFKGWRYRSRAPARSHRIRVFCHIDQTDEVAGWQKGLRALAEAETPSDEEARQKNLRWWGEFWERSYLRISGDKAGETIARNYALFRYMQASNLTGREPTVFNGGLFTFDPLYANGLRGPGYTPDHRQWGAAFTAQNQRLIYWPMLKNGDFDLMPPGFSFYLDGLVNATERVRHYWGHDGCCFEEQSAITALPGACQYGFHEGGGRGRPKGYEVGIQVNEAGGMVYEEQLDWSWLILEYHRFSGRDISRCMAFIERSVIFYDEHYRYRLKQRTGRELDEDGRLVIYPANTLEGHWNCRNPASVIAGLHQVLTRLLELPEKYSPPEKKKRWREVLARLPELPVGTAKGHRILKPAENFGHTSWHMPEMYPLFPYQVYGLGMEDLALMRDTFMHGVSRGSRDGHQAWRQGFIHYARLGMRERARRQAVRKLSDGPHRFPAFWPKDIDWVPDHNWGGCGMIGLQEMLMQTHPAAPASLRAPSSGPSEERTDRGGGTSSVQALRKGEDRIRLLPAWPKEWDVDFKLHAPRHTVVEGSVRGGEVRELRVTPESRRKDVVVMSDRRPAE